MDTPLGAIALTRGLRRPIALMADLAAMRATLPLQGLRMLPEPRRRETLRLVSQAPHPPAVIRVSIRRDSLASTLVPFIMVQGVISPATRAPSPANAPSLEAAVELLSRKEPRRTLRRAARMPLRLPEDSSPLRRQRVRKAIAGRLIAALDTPPAVRMAPREVVSLAALALAGASADRGAFTSHGSDASAQ